MASRFDLLPQFGMRGFDDLPHKLAVVLNAVETKKFPRHANALLGVAALITQNAF
jgi:hypothetical protein